MSKQLVAIGDTGNQLVSKFSNNANDLYTRTGFNILDYGAVSGGVLETQTAIMAAITATESTHGTVIIPSGTWLITSSVILKSFVNINVQSGANFVFASGYTGSMWRNNGKLINCHVTGGIYTGATKGWNLIDLISNIITEFVAFNVFLDMYVVNCNIAINLSATTTGWVNGNVFLNIISLYSVMFAQLQGAIGSTTGDGRIGGNEINGQLEPSADTTYGVKLSYAGYNKITVQLWDFVTIVTSGVIAHLDLNTSYNEINCFIGHNQDSNIIDLGWGNKCMSNIGFSIGYRLFRIQSLLHQDQVIGALTDNTPTNSEINTLILNYLISINNSFETIKDGFQCTIKDNSGSGLLYRVEYNGTDWYYTVMTKAL